MKNDGNILDRIVAVKREEEAHLQARAAAATNDHVGMPEAGGRSRLGIELRVADLPVPALE